MTYITQGQNVFEVLEQTVYCYSITNNGEMKKESLSEIDSNIFYLLRPQPLGMGGPHK